LRNLLSPHFVPGNLFCQGGIFLILNGIDRPERWLGLLSGQRVGLLTSAAGLNAQLQRNLDALMSAGVRVTTLFGPEHGIRGDAAAGNDVAAGTDPRTNLPVFSLYRKESKRFTENMLRDVDVVVYDMADVGARFYTYITTLLYTVEDCGRTHVPLVVLDRVNPLGGAVIEGCALAADCHSFIGDYDLPIRYGLTAGEFAMMVNAERRCGCDLTVVPVAGWRRHQLHCDTGLPWIPPSPALQHFENALLYPGTCLLEGVNVSEGRGTADPFLLIGAPYIDGERLAEHMNSLSLPGVAFIPAHFTPAERKYAGVACSGVKILLTDAHACFSVTVGVRLLDAIRSLWPSDFAFLPPGQEFDRPALDLLSGNDRLRRGQSAHEWLGEAQADCAAFAKRCLPYHLNGGD